MTGATSSDTDQARYSLPSDSDRRLTLTPPDPTVRSAGEVDGAWLSVSDDLDFEAPELVAALARRLGLLPRDRWCW